MQNVHNIFVNWQSVWSQYWAFWQSLDVCFPYKTRSANFFSFRFPNYYALLQTNLTLEKYSVKLFILRAFSKVLTLKRSRHVGATYRNEFTPRKGIYDCLPNIGICLSAFVFRHGVWQKQQHLPLKADSRQKQLQGLSFLLQICMSCARQNKCGV